MTDIGNRYGYAPTTAFAATLASAEQRRARAAATAAATTSGSPTSRSRQFLHRLTTLRRQRWN